MSSICPTCSDNHKNIDCALRKSFYCYICCIYGHSPNNCPNERAKAIRRGKNPSMVKNRELCILDTNEAIRIFLTQHSVKEQDSYEENREALINLANSFTPPFMVTFISSKKNEKKDEDD